MRIADKADRRLRFAVRAYIRCRPHAVYCKFGLCRGCLREMELWH